jgi:hypothetical protein
MDEPSRLMKGVVILMDGLLIETGSLRMVACEKADKQTCDKQTIAKRRVMGKKFDT